MTRQIHIVISTALWALGMFALPAGAASKAPATAPDKQEVIRSDMSRVLQAEIVPVRKLYLAGQPVMVDFRIMNTTDEPVLLQDFRMMSTSDDAARPAKPSPAPAATTTRPAEAQGGLPLEYVFSPKSPGESMANRGSLVLTAAFDPMTDHGNVVNSPTSRPADPIVVRPHGILACRVDLAKYYPALTKAGRLTAQWRPCNGALRSPYVELRIMNEEKATIETTMGKMEIVFFYDKAPNHVENFLDLARNGFYEKTLFHRVILGFMIQGGDPYTADPAKKDRWGTGRGPRTLKQEFSDTPFVAGIVGAARGPDVNSASCQFFIVTGEASHLTGQYTAFGQLADAESRRVADKISKVQVTGDPSSPRPATDVRIERITVEPLRGSTTRPE